MKPKGPLHERETIIRFSDENSNMTVWTASGKIYRRLKLLGLEITEEGERHAVFSCTTKNLTLRKAHKALTDEQRAQIAARLTLSRKKPSGPSVPDSQSDS